MAIILPDNKEQIVQRMQTDFVANIPESDPFLRASWLLALIIAISGREFDIYTQVGQILLDLFPNTATGIFARQWGNLKGTDTEAATSAKGFISVTGTTGTLVPQGTLWNNAAGTQYESIIQDYTILATTLNIINLTSSGGIAEAETSSTHKLASGMSITVSGATQTEYNVTATITVISETKFQYPISGTPISPATGTIIVAATYASVEVQALDTGEQTNVGSGAQLSLSTPLSGIDNTAYVQFTEIGGGTDDETDDAYRTRYLERYQQPQAHFNPSDIIIVAKEVPGVTRVSVFQLVPEIGDVSVFFMRDNDDDPIPNLQEVNDVKAALERILPANTPFGTTAGLIVKAPTPRTIDFTFTNLVPNTSTMKTAIEESLVQFFRERTDVGQDILQLDYVIAIKDTIDPATGQFVETFTLSQPAGDITINFGEIGILGTVTFNI